MSKLIALSAVFLLVISCYTAFAQQPDPGKLGTVKGIARDTLQNYVLRSATVSVFKAADSTLISYQLTNSYGEFKFSNLPLGLPLKVEISHVGYATARKNFTIPADKKELDLKVLVMNTADQMLKNVVITVPPISMNGDTLEFNAAAFKLDSNAVVEDLLRKIPNIVVWGDGQITVNGREVKSVKVNGKSFFGGDPKIATQNIAKNALQKIQVYNTARNESNPLDSTLEMNLKLKKGKDIGFFGKIGGGYGSDNRYEADASINMFSPKMQLALVAALNNINKTPNNINNLMSNSTFKGQGTNMDYQSDFRQSGLNQPSAAGLKFNYNFIQNPTYQSKSTLSSDYFIQDKDSRNLNQTTTTTTVNNADKIVERNSNTNSASNTDQRINNNYELTKNGHSLELSQSLNLNRGENNGQTFRTAGNEANERTSTNNTVNQNNFNNSNFSLRANYRFSPSLITQKMRIRGGSLSYGLNVFDNENQRKDITQFRSFTDASANRDFNRRFDTRSEGERHEINAELPSLKYLLMRDKRFLNIDFTLTNSLNLNRTKDHNEVQDLDTISGIYRPNVYLNNDLETRTIDETPGLKIQRSFRKSLSNRFYKSLTISLTPKHRFSSQDNRSDRSFQNIKRNYNQFSPDVSLSYNDNQYGEYYRYLTLAFNTSMDIPSIQQLAPLTDSTNLYYLFKGNINLRQSVRRAISFNFSHNDQSTKNTLNYYFNGSVGLVDQAIVDSVLIDDQNRRTVYLVNADGNRYFNTYMSVRKAYKFKNAELQVNLSSNLSGGRNPNYTNNKFTFSNNFNSYSEANVNYTYGSLFALALSQNYNTYRSVQQAFNTSYSGKGTGTTLSSLFNANKRLTLNSNVTFNHNSSSGGAPVNFTIWNASVIYRLMKGNNAEIKFSALDLLRQNSSVINYGSANSVTVGTQNVLKQYFMTTISYYPRQFGKKKSN